MTLVLPTLTCTRCQHTWHPRQPQPPKFCPQCRSPYWDKPRRNPRAEERGPYS